MNMSEQEKPEQNSDDLFGWASINPGPAKSVEVSDGESYPFNGIMLPEPKLDRSIQPSMKIFIPLFLFGIGMAFLESAVVVYLRDIWKIANLFPVENIFENGEKLGILKIEFAREAATLLMLVSISCALGRNIWQCMAYLLFLFGVWDIFYYAWLWVLVGWPQSLLSWDVLFFIPYTMVSPVSAPVAVSAIMIFCGMMIIHAQRKRVVLKATRRFWFMEVLAFTLIYTSFIWETGKVNAGLPESKLHYPWLILVLGLTIGLTAFLFLVSNCFKRKRYDFDLYVSRKI